MEQDLFRKEFLEARARADFGEVALPPQRAVRIAAVVSMVTVALLLAVLATLPYTRMETNMGFVISDADAFAVTSAFKGPVRVENILVGSGDLIMPGKPMLVVSMETGEEGLDNESRSNSLAVMTNSRRTDGVEGGGSWQLYLVRSAAILINCWCCLVRTSFKGSQFYCCAVKEDILRLEYWRTVGRSVF